MAHPGGPRVPVLAFDEDAYCDALLDVEHVLVLRPVRRGLLLFCVAVEIQHVNIVEGIHEALAHPAERRVVEVTVVADKRKDTVARAFDAPLREPDELHVIVVQPFRIALAQRFAVHFKITGRSSIGRTVRPAEEIGNPPAVIDRVSRIGRVAQYHHDGVVGLDLTRRVGFLGDDIGEQRQVAQLERFLERIGQVDAQPFAGMELITRLGQLDAQFHMGHRVRRHQKLEPEQTRQQMRGHVTVPCAGAVRARDRIVDAVDNTVQERPRADRRVEYEHLVDLAGLAFCGTAAPGHMVFVHRHFISRGETLADAEIALKDLVDRPDYIRDHRLRRVVNAACLPQTWIVRRQERLIEVDNGILLPRAFAEIA